VSILTTNLDASIDPALRRRLAAMVTFWPPDDEERKRLWQHMLTARAPVAKDIDFEALSSKYDKMTGANIRNAVIAAAFLAAAEQTSITQACLDRAARGEYASMGRVMERK
jgi:SpoVK/Ycf46/Vps4 family AAA+-type ATPase